MIFRVWLRILPSSKQKPFQCLSQPGLKAVGGPVSLRDGKPVVIRASHGPRYIERLVVLLSAAGSDPLDTPRAIALSNLEHLPRDKSPGHFAFAVALRADAGFLPSDELSYADH